MAALAMRKYSRVALAAKGSKKPMLRNMEAPETADAVREELAMKSGVVCDGYPVPRQYLTLLVQSYDFYLEERKKGAKRVRGGEKGQRFFSTRNRKFWDFVNWPRTYFRRQWEKKDFLYALFFGYCDAASVVITGMLGITLSYHRQLAHLSFKSPKIVEYFLAYCGSLAVQSHPINWVPRPSLQCPLIDIITAPLHLGIAVTVGQDTANDVHSPKDGFWWSHAGWSAMRHSEV
ncbi:unnamed protein product [Symbiodinium necroappetens]|uniref:Uncharacterized protein n=1 Tax=Symbiodinium necroappetens TaxID=1628268 RepID=A0A812UQ77_9DINO|nr:unnamed protein product [Symbiodinium necroappetens]